MHRLSVLLILYILQVIFAWNLLQAQQWARRKLFFFFCILIHSKQYIFKRSVQSIKTMSRCHQCFIPYDEVRPLQYLSEIWVLLIGQHENSWCCRSILNLECAVLPPGNRRDAIPDDATVRQIHFSLRNLQIIVFHRNVFPVPPLSLTK